MLGELQPSPCCRARRGFGKSLFLVLPSLLGLFPPGLFLCLSSLGALCCSSFSPPTLCLSPPFLIPRSQPACLRPSSCLAPNTFPRPVATPVDTDEVWHYRHMHHPSPYGSWGEQRAFPQLLPCSPCSCSPAGSPLEQLRVSCDGLTLPSVNASTAFHALLLFVFFDE